MIGQAKNKQTITKTEITALYIDTQTLSARLFHRAVNIFLSIQNPIKIFP